MESEDDMNDANELSSMEDDNDYYSGGDEDEDMDDDDDDDSSCGGYGEDRDNTGDDDFIATDDDGDDVAIANRWQKSYSILKEEDIRQRQEEDITKISTVLLISREASSILLRRYNWVVNAVHEQWFADEESVRKSVGLLDNSNSVSTHRSNKKLKLTCGICFDSLPSNNLRSAGCSHLFCNTCWKSYITTSINDGPGCLMLRCPGPSCGTAIGQDMINELSSEEDKQKYQRYLIRSYVEDSRKIKWCPAPGCDSAVEYKVGSGSYDVICSCSYSFCWNCTEEAHRPVDCETVAKWILKNSVESENTNWILDNSKPCPKCKRPIEKNQGCMHMTCRTPCSFQFCWLCLGAWSDHGYRACNRYKTANQGGVYDESERRREMAKNALERYAHYYERWVSNQTSRQKALTDLHLMKTLHLEKLSEKQGQPESQLKFIVEAWQQVVECRRVLTWTYSYGYYLPEHENTRKQFFEYLQGEAEAGLERLHQCAEKELLTYLNADGPSEDFNDFRRKLAGLTGVTRNYFENLVRALENGLSDVDSQAVSNRIISRNVSGISKNKGGKTKGSSKTGTSAKSGDDSGNWACDLCTYMNVGSATSCHICQ